MVEEAGAVYLNFSYWIEFLDELLRTSGDNLLQENPFVILSSLEMTALTWTCSIVNISVCLPTIWLAGNSHKWVKYKWTVHSMGKMVDMLEVDLEDIINDETLFTNETYMMGIFKKLLYELTPFGEYWEHIFKKKSMHLAGHPSNKVSQFSKLPDESFSLENDTNKKTLPMMVDMGVTAAIVLLAELQNKNKAMYSTCLVLGGSLVQ
eukprot:13661516-Ditylum_brightwellii.AAC.2